MTLAGTVLRLLQELELTKVGLRQHGGMEWFKTVTTANSFKKILRGAWVAQWVKASAFGSGHDPGVLGSSPASGSLLRGEPAFSSLSACLSAYL